MQVVDLRLSGLKLVTPQIFSDVRGSFFESYRRSLYVAQGMAPVFVQDNVVRSCKNSLRALHYQLDPGQDKLITCLEGKIFDVAVDIRPGSATFGQWEAVELDDQTHQQLFIPIGFAHGYCTLSEAALVSYKVSAAYNPHFERTIRWNDPHLKIHWPISHPILSSRDATSPWFHEVFI